MSGIVWPYTAMHNFCACLLTAPFFGSKIQLFSMISLNQDVYVMYDINITARHDTSGRLADGKLVLVDLVWFNKASIQIPRMFKILAWVGGWLGGWTGRDNRASLSLSGNELANLNLAWQEFHKCFILS